MKPETTLYSSKFGVRLELFSYNTQLDTFLYFFMLPVKVETEANLS